MEEKYFLYRPTNLIGEFEDKESFAKFIIDNHKDKIDSVIKEKAWISHYIDFSMSIEKSHTYYPYLVEEVCKLIEQISEEEVKEIKERENQKYLSNKSKPLEERLTDLYIKKEEYSYKLEKLEEEGF